MSSDLSVTHGRVSGLPGLRQQIIIDSFMGPCARGASSRGSALSPGLVSRGNQSAQVWLRPLRDQLADGCQTSSWPDVVVATAASPDRNEDLKKPPLLCPPTDAKEGALLLFGREAQRQPRLDSRVWVDGCHPYFSSTGRQDPAPGRKSIPPCEGLRVFLPENVDRFFQPGGWKCQQCHQGEAKTCHVLGTASLWVMPQGVQAL